MALIRGIIVDPSTRTIRGIEFEPSLAEYYRLLDCEQIEGTHLFDRPLTSTVVGEMPGHFIDEGTGLIPATVSKNWGYPICGPFIVAGRPDQEGVETSIGEEEIAEIVQELRAVRVLPINNTTVFINRSYYSYLPL